MSVMFTSFEPQDDLTLKSFTSAGGRSLSNCVSDVVYHGIECSVSPFCARGTPPVMKVTAVVGGRFITPDGTEASCCTAARIEGEFEVAGNKIPFVIRAAKCVAARAQGLEFFGKRYSLAGGKWEPHFHVLTELLQEERHPQLWMTLADHAMVADICDQITQTLDGRLHDYEYGTTPDWL